LAVPKHSPVPAPALISDTGVAELFLKAVSVNPDDAWTFVSKVHAHGLDLEALHAVLGADSSCLCCHVVTAPYAAKSPFITRSVLVENRWLLHLKMIKEPDQYGPWKIYGVDQEECAKKF